MSTNPETPEKANKKLPRRASDGALTDTPKKQNDADAAAKGAKSSHSADKTAGKAPDNSALPRSKSIEGVNVRPGQNESKGKEPISPSTQGIVARPAQTGDSLPDQPKTTAAKKDTQVPADTKKANTGKKNAQTKPEDQKKTGLESNKEFDEFCYCVDIEDKR